MAKKIHDLFISKKTMGVYVVHVIMDRELKESIFTL